MKRATPVQMRKSLEVVDTFKKAGLWFVPIPIADENEFNSRVAEMTRKLEAIELEASEEECQFAHAEKQMMYGY